MAWPSELLRNIGLYLEYRDLLRLQCTCTRFHNLLGDADSLQVWSRLYRRDLSTESVPRPSCRHRYLEIRRLQKQLQSRPCDVKKLAEVAARKGYDKLVPGLVKRLLRQYHERELGDLVKAAIVGSHYSLAQQLLDQGLSWYEAIDVAASDNHPTIIKFIYSMMSDQEPIINYALMRGVKHNQTSIIDVALSYSPDRSVIDRALLHAVRQGHLSAVKRLFPHATFYGGLDKALQAAHRRHDDTMVQLLRQAWTTHSPTN
jgi:hypothetical protein